MDAQVRRSMLRFPIQWQSLTSVNGAGEKTYATAVTLNSYPVGKIVMLTNRFGDKVVSTKHFYIDASNVSQIKVDDLIQASDSSLKYPILAIELFYKENNMLDYGVVYLK